MLSLKQLPQPMPALLPPNRTTSASRKMKCSALPGPHLLLQLQQQVTIEGVLHVSALQSHSCMQDFRDLQSLSAPGLLTHQPHSVQDVLRAAEATSSSSSSTVCMARTALCLATPEDSVDDEIQELRLDRDAVQSFMAGARTAGRANVSASISTRISSSSSSFLRAPLPAAAESVEASTASTMLREELAILQGVSSAAWQATELYGCEHTVSVLRAAAARRRQRRRALISALRAARSALVQVVDCIALY